MGSGSIQCAWSRRPTWATVVGSIGIVFAGLGLFLFLVRRTETCTVTVVDGPRGAHVTLSGNLEEAALRRVLAAVQGSPATHGGASSAPATLPGLDHLAARPQEPATGGWVAPVIGPTVASPPERPLTAPAAGLGVVHDAGPAHPGVDAERTVARPAAAPAPARRLRVRFDHGPVNEVLAPLLVGRDPAVTSDTLAGALLVAVPDPTMSVSKTHLLLSARDGRLWVEDLHSTNGTAVTHPSGERVVAAPGSPVALPPGAVVEFGRRRAEVLADV